ncbi:MAG: SEC-C metal-binding domain-containing protein, partial [Gemmatimonadaceae bacterium]
EAIKMVETAVGRRIETTLADFDDSLDWDLDLVRQDLLMHYLPSVPCFEPDGTLPQNIADAKVEGGVAGTKAFHAKMAQLAEHANQVLALVMLNVLDEKWKDHLYDLDQLRGSIGYRAWGQKDPLLEYKQEAYSMFVDLMTDIQHTFTERFLRVQLMYEPPAPPPPPPEVKRRFNALGVAEDVPEDEVLDIGPSETPGEGEVVKPDPMIVGAGRARSLSGAAAAGPLGGTGVQDWSTVGRNDPCPCGSGKKFKKCHGATM